MQIRRSAVFRTPRSRAVSFLILAFLFSTGASMRAEESAKRVFNLPADVAEKTLKLFSEQSGRGMVVGASTVKGVRTNPVNGEFTAREALDRMLSGTGLVATHDARSGAF